MREAGNGILIKSGEALETAHRVDAVVLDKTGTVTEGRPKVTDIYALKGYRKKELLCLAASCEQNSEQSAGTGNCGGKKKRGLTLSKPDFFRSMTGKGLAARMGEREILIGNERMMEEERLSAECLKREQMRRQAGDRRAMFVAEGTGA